MGCLLSRDLQTLDKSGPQPRTGGQTVPGSLSDDGSGAGGSRVMENFFSLPPASPTPARNHRDSLRPCQGSSYRLVGRQGPRPSLFLCSPLKQPLHPTPVSSPIPLVVTRLDFFPGDHAPVSILGGWLAGWQCMPGHCSAYTPCEPRITNWM